MGRELHTASIEGKLLGARDFLPAQHGSRRLHLKLIRPLLPGRQTAAAAVGTAGLPRRKRRREENQRKEKGEKRELFHDGQEWLVSPAKC
jgi:hypothetical protein